LRERSAEVDRIDPGKRSEEPVFASEATLRLRDEIKQVRNTDVNILITGPTGAGKDVLARWIHDTSSRAAKRYTIIDLPSKAPTLIESELFGHKKGAFNEAKSDRPGLLKSTAGGTVVLNEIGDLPYSLQAKLRRAVEDKVITPVGGDNDIAIDVRFIALTNRNLDEDVRTGAFREDLYFRLRGIHFEVPPLRNRKEEIVPLAEYFLREHGSGAVNRIDPDLEAWFVTYEWPGNVRELRDDVIRGLTRAKGDVLTVEDVYGRQDSRKKSESAPGSTTPHGSFLPDFPMSIEDAKVQMMRIYCAELLRFTKGDVTKASEIAGVERTSLHRIFSRIGIDANDFRP
jgi:DNA-binding NtrC family response regulator